MGYRLEGFLGAGGFGAVYLTTTPRGEKRAVKVLYPPRSRKAEDMGNYRSCAARFMKEFLIPARFNHHNIIRIYDAGLLQWHFKASGELSEFDGDYDLYFYVADYIPDGLEQKLADGQTLAADEVVDVARQVLEGLAALHSFTPPVLHLDLNPANIRLAEGSRAVITDFGVACGEGVVDKTTGEIVLPAFHPGVAAPEQYSCVELDVRTDIYQFGALSFKMLTGKFPREMTGSCPNRTDVQAELNRKGVPNDLAGDVCRCLEISREDRFSDVNSLRATPPFRRTDWFWRLIQFISHSIPPPEVLKRALVLLVVALVLGGVIFTWMLLQPINITIASSSDKKAWTNQAVAAFNEDYGTSRLLRFQGRPIHIEVLLEEITPGVWDHYRSGTMIEDTLKRKIEPTILSPAEQSWIQKLKEDWPGPRSVTSDEGSGLLRTPIVIAMWRSRSEALGCWPTSGPNCSWERLRALSASPDGWGMFGHPEWGTLKYGYAVPGKSNSATFTQVLNCISGLQKRGLTYDDVRPDNGCGRAIGALRKPVRICDKSDICLRLMREEGPANLDATTAYEQQVIDLNAGWGPTLAEPVVAVYPQDGTILATHPLSILDGAPWVKPEQAKAAEIFLRFLLSKPQQSVLPRYGFRPLDDSIPLGSFFDPRYGVTPKANLVLVDVPNSQVINAVVKLWDDRPQK